ADAPACSPTSSLRAASSPRFWPWWPPAQASPWSPKWQSKNAKAAASSRSQMTAPTAASESCNSSNTSAAASTAPFWSIYGRVRSSAMCRYGSSAWLFETWRTCTNQKPAPSEGACTVEFIQSLVLRPLGLIQHAFSQNAVRPSLISLVVILHPRDHLYVVEHLYQWIIIVLY